MSTKQQKEFWSVFQTIFDTGKEWNLKSIEFDDIAQEVVIVVTFHTDNPICPICKKTDVKFMLQNDSKKGYYSFLGYKTYINAPDLYIECTTHGTQRIKPPWEKKMEKYFS